MCNYNSFMFLVIIGDACATLLLKKAGMVYLVFKKTSFELFKLRLVIAFYVKFIVNLNLMPVAFQSMHVCLPLYYIT